MYLGASEFISFVRVIRVAMGGGALTLNIYGVFTHPIGLLQLFLDDRLHGHKVGVCCRYEQQVCENETFQVLCIFFFFALTWQTTKHLERRKENLGGDWRNLPVGVRGDSS